MKRILVILGVVIGLAVVAAPVASASPSGSCTMSVRTQAGWFNGRVTRSSQTSCLFARNVASASLRAIIRMGGVGNGPIQVRAYSPVTHATYRVSCHANGDIWSRRGVAVDCRAGIGARVAYRAWSR